MSEVPRPKKLKVVLLGNRSVGKSSIIRRYVLNDFTQNMQPTIGVDYMSKTITLSGKQYRLELWDTAGQEKYRSLVKGYLKNADACIYVYDCKNINSYIGLVQWVNTFQSANANNAFCLIAGNKVDACQEKDLEQLAEGKQIFTKKNNKLSKFEQVLCSAKQNQNIQHLFEKIARNCGQTSKESQNQGMTILGKVKNGQVGCCGN